jgi:hypothetical protein
MQLVITISMLITPYLSLFLEKLFFQILFTKPMPHGAGSSLCSLFYAADLELLLLLLKNEFESPYSQASETGPFPNAVESIPQHDTVFV